jgi:hypothetical protein
MNPCLAIVIETPLEIQKSLCENPFDGVALNHGSRLFSRRLVLRERAEARLLQEQPGVILTQLFEPKETLNAQTHC